MHIFWGYAALRVENPIPSHLPTSQPPNPFGNEGSGSHGVPYFQFHWESQAHDKNNVLFSPHFPPIIINTFSATWLGGQKIPVKKEIQQKIAIKNYSEKLCKNIRKFFILVKIILVKLSIQPQLSAFARCQVVLPVV